MDTTTECQWCESTNTYEAGHSPMCKETRYKCRECNNETWKEQEKG